MKRSPRANPRLPDDEVNLPQTHPLREAGLLVVATVVLAVAATMLIANLVDLLVFAIPPAAEASIAERVWWGEELDDAQGGGEETASDARREDLQQLLDRISAGWPESPYRFRVRIIDEPRPNAFALPGGWILVTRGLLDETDSENALAFVLAHEVGHFRERDHLRILGRTALVELSLAALGIGGGDTELVGSAGLLTTLSYSRAQERAADRFALALVHLHYGHVAESSAFFEQRAREEAGASALPDFGSTHPGSDDRAQELRDWARDRGWPLEGPVRPGL